MARDQRIDRSAELKPARPAVPVGLSREERVKLLVACVLGDVKTRIDQKRLPPKPRRKD